MGSTSSVVSAQEKTDNIESNPLFYPAGSSEGEQKLKPTEDGVSSHTSLEYLQEQKKHPELKETLRGFDLMVQLLRRNNTDDLSEVEDILQENFSQPLVVFSSKEQTKVLGNALAQKGFAEVGVEYYTMVSRVFGIDCFTDDLLLEGELFARVLYLLRGCMWNYSDKSVLFCQRLAATKMFSFLVKDLEALEPRASELKNTDWTYLSVLGILHNCAKARVPKHTFRDSDIVSHLIPFLKTPHNLIKLTTLLTLAYITEEDQNHLLTADHTLFDFFLQRLRLCLKCKDLRFDGYSFEEQLAGLAGIAKNDANKSIIMEKGALDIIERLFEMEVSDEILESAAVLLWELSFDEQNKKKIKENKKVMQRVEELCKSTNKKISKAASGVLWTISLADPTDVELNEEFGGIFENNIMQMSDRHALMADLEEKAQQLSDQASVFKKKSRKHKKTKEEKKVQVDEEPAVTENKGHIMISYNWSDQQELIKVRDHLKAAGYIIWMDIDDMEGSTLKAMADAVEKAAVVLMCMSERYKDSQNCRIEAEYAWMLRKDIIPLKMQRQYKPDGWLGILLGTRLFFEFSGKYSFDKKIEELIKELGNRGRLRKPNGAGHVLKPVDDVDTPVAAVKVPTLTVTKNSPNVWTENDVGNFLKKNKLENVEDLKDLTGPEILFLQKLSKKAPEYFYSYCERRLGVTRLRDLMNLTNAVETL